MFLNKWIFILNATSISSQVKEVIIKSFKISTKIKTMNSEPDRHLLSSASIVTFTLNSNTNNNNEDTAFYIADESTNKFNYSLVSNESLIGISDIIEHAANSSSLFNQLFHQPINIQFRVAVLWTIAVLGVVGNILVLLWLFANRNRRSRINLLILHLTVADILVIAWAICPQLAWEYAQRSWEMGDTMCRLFKFLQTVAISVSNYMVVVLAIDRYCAIRRPLKKAFPVLYLAGSAWILAIIFNVANFVLYETKEIHGAVYCRNMLYDHPEVYMQAYITAIAVFVVILPLFIIGYTYARIFQKISDKTSESQKSKRSSIKPGKIHLQATPSSTLPKAKAKTFKMTIVIVMLFLLCSTPYFICDIYRVYGGQYIAPATWAILGALAVSNSSTNPFVFLGFNSTSLWWLKFFSGKDTNCNKRLNHSGNNTFHTHSENVTLESFRVSGGDHGGSGSVGMDTGVHVSHHRSYSDNRRYNGNTLWPPNREMVTTTLTVTQHGENRVDHKDKFGCNGTQCAL